MFTFKESPILNKCSEMLKLLRELNVWTDKDICGRKRLSSFPHHLVLRVEVCEEAGREDPLEQLRRLRAVRRPQADQVARKLTVGQKSDATKRLLYTFSLYNFI